MTQICARPGVADAQPWSFPVPHEFWLDNGARVWLYDLPSQHVISAQLALDVPVSCEPTTLEGVATIAVRAGDEGSLDNPGTLLAEQIEGQGAIYGAAANQSGTICRLEVPGIRLPRSLELLAEIVRRPAYEAADVERHVALRLAEIEQVLVRSSSLVQFGFQRAVFDPQTRAGRPTAGRAAQVAAITRDDVADFHARWWRPDDATITLAGALPANAEQLVTEIFGDWAGADLSAPHQPMQPNPQAPVVWVIDRPGAVQADIQIGMAGPDRNDPRWAALEVAACAVGGSFGSRLNTVLREEKGYTYGAHAGFRPQRSGGSFAMRTSCRTEVAAQATVEALRLLDIAADPLTEAEVDDARAYLLGVAPLHFQTAETIADQAVSLAMAAMPPDWINLHQAKVAATSAAEASAAFAEVVRPEALSIVVCGDASQLIGELAAQGITAEVLGADELLR